MNSNQIKEIIAKASFNQKQLAAVNAIFAKVIQLEEKVQALEGALETSKHVSTMLQISLDNQETYSRRPCLVVSGVDSHLKKDELQKVVEIIAQSTNASKEEVIENIDKLHGIGIEESRIKKDRQSVIVKFKTHSYKEKVYKQGKNISNHRIKFRP